MDHERLAPAYLVGERSRIVVFACDDPRVPDDSVATQACTSLPTESLARADIKLIGPMRPEYLRDLPAGVRAVIVDGVLGPPPGETVEIELIEMSGRDEPVEAISTHEQPIDEVVAIAQLLRDRPVVGRFVGVGVERPQPGTKPVAAPEASIDSLRAAVAHAVAELTVSEPPTPSDA